MNLSGYWVLAVAAILVVFAQQSDAGFIAGIKGVAAAIKDGFNEAVQNAADPGGKRARDTIRTIKENCLKSKKNSYFLNATNLICDGFLNGVEILEKSRKKAMEGISAAENLVFEQPAAAIKIVEEAFNDARTILVVSGVPVFQGIGGALALSNCGALPELDEASQLIQRGGFGPVDTLITAEIYAIQGLNSDKKVVKVVITAARLILDTGYAGAYSNILKANEKALNATRTAESTLWQCNTGSLNDQSSVDIDPETRDAINHVNESAKNAKANGADPNLVDELKDAIVKALRIAAKIQIEGRQIVENVQTIADFDPLTALTTFYKRKEVVKKLVHDAAAPVHVAIGNVAVKSGNPNNQKFAKAIEATLIGQIEIISSIQTTGETIAIGLRYQGDAPDLAFEAGAKVGYSGKIALVIGFVKAGDEGLAALQDNSPLLIA